MSASPGEYVRGSEMTCCMPRHPDGWRRIEVDVCHKRAFDAARVLVVLGAADEVYPTWFGVPHPAVWSLNGVAMLPADATSGGSRTDQ